MKKSAVVKLFAGLGNQIFQYVYGRYLSEKGYDVTFLQDTKVDDFSNVFKTDEDTIKPCKYIKTNNKVKIVAIKILHKYVLKNYYADYFQNKLYSLKILPELSHTLVFKNEKSYKNTSEYKTIISSKSVSLHIRGGDYHKEPNYANICTKEYYQKAIKAIAEQKPDVQFFVFTNDLQYAHSITEGFENITYIQNENFTKDPGFDLFLMTQCKHNIIANSTFSWWGAFLNQNIEKIVICPSKWTNDILDVINNFAIESWRRL